MKKYLLITALCAVNFAYADGFESLKNLQNQFHLLIYNAGDLGAATPAPEVPYIAGLLTNPVESMGAGEERHIYEFLYDQPSGRNRKAIPDIDQAKVDAFNTINFTNFQRYRSYQDSGHSVFGIAAQEQLPPIEKVTIMSAVPRASPIVVNSSSSSSNAPTGPGLFAGGGGSFELPKLRRATTNASSTSVSATAPKSLLERVREHKKTLRNQVDIELLTELEAELSRGASEASLASDRYNDLVEFFNLLTTPAFEVVTQQIALEKNINSLRQKLKPSGASIIAAASNDATPENVQIAIDSARYDNNLLSELLERLQRPHLNNTPYQQYRFDRLNSWFKNKDKPSVAAPQLKLINSIPAFVRDINVMDVQHAISNLLPANKQQLENLDVRLNQQYASAVGNIAKQKKSEIDTNKEKIKQIDKDQELLEELVAGLNAAVVDALRMQKLKEFYVTLMAGKDFTLLLANQRHDLSVLVSTEAAKPSGSSRLINMANGGVTSGVSDNSAIADKKREIKDLEKEESKAYNDGNNEAQEHAKKKLAKAYEELAILGDVEGVVGIERIDSDDLSDSEKRDIYVRIYNALEAGPRTPSEDAAFLRVAAKPGVRKVSAAPVVTSRHSPLDGNAGGGGVQLKPTIPPLPSLEAVEAVASVTELLGGVVASEQIVAEINRLGENSSNKKEILALVERYLGSLQQSEEQKRIIREIIPTIPEKITKPTIRTDVTNLMKEMTK
ncbi:MAG: hypothetical protein KBD04_02995 [Proteobacteria bacterium]|nr:hypothetical protein [Pseudomonadota bacterium]